MRWVVCAVEKYTKKESDGWKKKGPPMKTSTNIRKKTRIN